MSDKKHDEAIKLAEQALGKLAEHDEEGADKLIAEAKKLDKTALTEVVKDLEEDAADRA